MLAVGEVVGPYQLGTCLGQGTFGAVYEATHQESGQRVALKLLHSAKQMEPEVQNRFVREVALLERLNHQNIVRHWEAGLHDGSIYCAMELVNCGTLKEVLQARGRLPWREAAEVMLQLCRALEHAHSVGCIHRDLKPANLYLSDDGLVKLGDLGLARDMNDSRLTVQGQTVGTWRYMAPEQITGEAVIDGRLDLYAAGCLLFEMIAGRVPFDGPDFVSIFDQHLESPPPRLDSLVSDCPAALADLVDHLLKKCVQERPDNAAEVCTRLEAILLESRVAKNGAADGSSDTGEIAETAPVLNLTQRLQSNISGQSRDLNWLAFACVIGAVLVVLGIVLLRSAGN